jgi:hypothetical protein
MNVGGSGQEIGQKGVVRSRRKGERSEVRVNLTTDCLNWTSELALLLPKRMNFPQTALTAPRESSIV